MPKAGMREREEWSERKPDWGAEQNQVKNRIQYEKVEQNGGTAKSQNADCFEHVCVCEREREETKRWEKTTIRARRKCMKGPGDCQESVQEQETVSRVSPVF